MVLGVLSGADPKLRISPWLCREEVQEGAQLEQLGQTWTSCPVWNWFWDICPKLGHPAQYGAGSGTPVPNWDILPTMELEELVLGQAGHHSEVCGQLCWASPGFVGVYLSLPLLFAAI